jgi:predicted HNH restriction endonuclease
MTFRSFYGAAASHLVVVHHLDPMGNAKGSRKVDPIKDLIPVCANCHAVLHLRVPPLTIDEVQSLVQRRRRSR